jgi:GTP:adenosylcobinamide-phosphate guanylyltransferase
MFLPNLDTQSFAIMDGPALTVMIPLGGLGSRFANEGYTMRTKPFVRVLGKEMILWLTDKLNLRADDQLVIVYNPNFSNIKVRCLF